MANDQSSSLKEDFSGKSISEQKYKALHKSRNSSLGETNVATCSSLVDGIEDSETHSEHIRKKIPIGEKLSQEIEEIKSILFGK